MSFFNASKCSRSGCTNYGASYREGVFCSVHAAEQGLQRPRNGQCWRCEGLQQRSDLCVGGWVKVAGGVELPAPFTKIETRLPVVGDYVVTLVSCGAWMENSYARVVAVNLESRPQTASIHLDCSTVADLTFDRFVICGGGDRPPPPPPLAPSSMNQILSYARNFAGAPHDRPQTLPVPPAVVSQEVRDDLLETFFPNVHHGEGEVAPAFVHCPPPANHSGPGYGYDTHLPAAHAPARLTPPTHLPEKVIEELRDLFLPQWHWQHGLPEALSWEDLLMGMYSLVVTHCLRTPQIQSLGNAKFRSILRSAFESSVGGLPPDVQRCAAGDRVLLEGAVHAIETLCAIQEVDLARKPRQGTTDVVVTQNTPADEVRATVCAADARPRSAGPLTLLEWDADTQSLVDSLFQPLFASENPPLGNINRPLAGQSLPIYESLLAHFGDQALTKAIVLDELQLASSGVCVEFLCKPLRCYLERKSQRLCSRILCFRPGGRRGVGGGGGGVGGGGGLGLGGIPPFPVIAHRAPTSWPIEFDRSDIPDSVRRERNWRIEFNQVNFGVSFAPFLDAAELPDITGAKRHRIASETNRCFFIHLGAALNIHPVWLQEDFRRRAHDCIIRNQFCRELGAQPLLDVLTPNELIDSAVLYSCWPEYLRGVKLLFVNCRDYHREGRLAGQEIILPSTWTVIAYPAGFDREIVLKLSGNHFTLLQPAVPSLTDPASHLELLAMEVEFDPPQNRSELIWGPFDGHADDVSLVTDMTAVIQLQEMMQMQDLPDLFP